MDLHDWVCQFPLSQNSFPHIHSIPDDERKQLIEIYLRLSFLVPGNTFLKQTRGRELLLTLLRELYTNNEFKILEIGDPQERPENVIPVFTCVDTTNLSPVDSLLKYGVCTVKIYEENEIQSLRHQFIDECINFPEYLPRDEDNILENSQEEAVYVFPGFASLGNASSFHNTFVRESREKMYNIIIEELFKPLHDELIQYKDVLPGEYNVEDLKVEQLFDRMMYRVASMSATAESWHRDVVPGDRIDERDILFGGWVNFDPENQYFSCVPGSHLSILQSKLESGFADIPKDHIKKVGKYKYKFPCPPGHAIIFPQFILHEVVASPAPYFSSLEPRIAKGMMRLFSGWRLTFSDNPLTDLERLQTQDIMTLGGGMEPPLYDKNHTRYFLFTPPLDPETGKSKGGKRLIPKKHPRIPGSGKKKGLMEWSNETFIPQLLVDKTRKKSKSKPEKRYSIVQRYLPSLEKLSEILEPQSGSVKYKEYTMQEMLKHIPRKIQDL